MPRSLFTVGTIWSIVSLKLALATCSPRKGADYFNSRLNACFTTSLCQERPVGGLARRPGEKNHPRAELGILLPKERVEGLPVEVGHMEVRQDHVIGPRAKLGEGVTTIGELQALALENLR